MPAPKQSGRRLTRCRTGCMRCRIRRRKCDEGKPRCQNCVSRNFQCQYGPQLTFLTKNARTVEQPETGPTASNNYGAIRFVNEEPPIDNHGSPTPKNAPVVESPVLPTSTDTPTQEAAELPPQPDGPDDPAASSISQPSTTVFSDNDESAVAGLLALGTSNHEMITSDFNSSEFGVSPARPPSRGLFTPSLHDNYAVFSPDRLSQVHVDNKISPTETLELIRHYRYEIAPCLDICDLGQLFGIKGLQIAMVSPPVWNSILLLSDTSRSKLRPSQTIGDKLQAPPMPDGPEDSTTIALVRVLEATRNCIADVNAAWTLEKDRDEGVLEELSHRAMTRDLNAAIYWLFLRLDLGAALATDSNITTPLPPSAPYFPSNEPDKDSFGPVFCFAHRPLWLCARAVQFKHNEDSTPQCPPLHSWMQLVEGLEQWYQDRPQGFQPMMEFGIDDDFAVTGQNFSVVLFANGAGVFSNQLYHTAMLLLLHSRPRTAPIADFASARMSPLWHAQRICSIALNNDRRECWDPCLLASFLMASRCMTHEAQQQEILQGFENTRSVTGWDAGDFVRGLREEWSFLET